MTPARAIILNALGLYAIALVLIAAFAAQLILHELPCPLCLLQRVLFAALAIGPDPQHPLRAAPEPLRAIAVGGRGWRRGFDPPGAAAHHAW